MSAVFVLVGILAFLGALALIIRHAFPRDEEPLVDAINAVLPQTQCAQCGFAGCRPYARALAAGETTPDLCPPGGHAVVEQLSELLGVEASPSPNMTHSEVAFIREAECIGCGLCLKPCPVDAIVGAPGYMHTVLTGQCTGCELCVPACPVDCIDMENTSKPSLQPPRMTLAQPNPASAQDAGTCIRCGQCNDVCPVNLDAQQLYGIVLNNSSTTHPQAALAADALSRCIECGLCDEACPSNLPLTESFSATKAAADFEQRRSQIQDDLSGRHQRHTDRLNARSAAAATRRSQRLNAPRRSWKK